MAYIQSWGFFTSYWGIGTPDGHFTSWAQARPLYQPTLDALIAAGPDVCKNTILIVGEELNTCTSPEGLLDIVQHLAPICHDHDIPMWLHFTSNYPGWPRPGESKVQFWQGMHALGVKGQCWQSNAYDLAGTMGGHMADSRLYLEHASLDMRLVAFETRATAQLTGQCDEAHGCLTGYELLCKVREPGSVAPAVSGFGNGGRRPDGNPL
jgi:hypothetical protein